MPTAKDFSTLGENPSRQEILANWDPENNAFWEQYGKPIANQNLAVSTWALVLSFVVWTLWATIAAKLNSAGFHFSDEQIFTLAALPGLVGAFSIAVTFHASYNLLVSVSGTLSMIGYCLPVVSAALICA